MVYSNNLPVGVTRLVELMKKSISSGLFHPFTGPLTDQNGIIRCEQYSVLKPEDIMTMDWLNNNVIGTIPNIDELVDSAKDVVTLRGLNAATHTTSKSSLL